MNAAENSVIGSLKMVIEELNAVYYRGRGYYKTDQEKKEYEKENIFFKEMFETIGRLMIKYEVKSNVDHTGFEIKNKSGKPK